MSNSPDARRIGKPPPWETLARSDPEQSQRFLAEALALLLADLLRAVLSDASPAAPAEDSAVERYRSLADALAWTVGWYRAHRAGADALRLIHDNIDAYEKTGTATND